MIKSPCLNCIRRGENKNEYTCKVCFARADFALASQGDLKAAKRFAAFKYTKLGVLVKEPENGWKVSDEEHYQKKYFSSVGKKVNAQFGTKFETIREVVVFLYEKYQNQQYISREFFNISVTSVRRMLVLFEVKTLSMSKCQKMVHKKRREMT